VEGSSALTLIPANGYGWADIDDGNVSGSALTEYGVSTVTVISLGFMITMGMIVRKTKH